MALILSTGIKDQRNNDLKTALTNFVIHCYSLPKPASSNLPATGTLLGSITVGGGTFTPGSPTNGLNFDASSAGVLSKAAAEEWRFKGIAAGTLGWFRICANAVDNNSESTTLLRMDGTIGVGTGDLRMATTESLVNRYITIDEFDLS